MATITMNNTAELDGVYNDIPFQNTESSEASVQLSDITFVKEASQTLWLNGPLTFTLTINNTGGAGPLTSLVITDQLDPDLFLLDDDDIIVKIDDQTLVKDTDYTVGYSALGLLTITIIGGNAVAVDSILRVTFHGTKA